MNSNEKMKHTPGPWHRNIRDGGRCPVVFTGRNRYVTVVSQQLNPDETEANIDLIAAAPDLLAACQDLVAFYSPQSDSGYPVWTKARSAIAKALNQAL